MKRRKHTLRALVIQLRKNNPTASRYDLWNCAWHCYWSGSFPRAIGWNYFNACCKKAEDEMQDAAQ